MGLEFRKCCPNPDIRRNTRVVKVVSIMANSMQRVARMYGLCFPGLTFDAQSVIEVINCQVPKRPEALISQQQQM